MKYITRRQDYIGVAVLVALVLLEYWLRPNPQPRWYGNLKLVFLGCLIVFVIWGICRLRRREFRKPD